MTNTPRLMTLAMLVLALCFGLRSNAFAQACTPTTGTPPVPSPCASATWTPASRAAPEFYGAYTDLHFGAIHLGDTGGIFHRVLLQDQASPQCAAIPEFGACWISAGVVAIDPASPPSFFWAAAQPAPTHAYHLHLLGPVTRPGTYHLMLIKDARTQPNPFLAFVYNDGLSTLFMGSVLPVGAAPMSARILQIGSEASKELGDTFDRTQYTRNIRAVAPLGPEYVFWYVPETTTGTLYERMPPYGQWTALPGAPGSPEGGKFETKCCDAF